MAGQRPGEAQQAGRPAAGHATRSQRSAGRDQVQAAIRASIPGQGQRSGQRANASALPRVNPNATASPLIRGAWKKSWGNSGNYGEKLFAVLGNLVNLLANPPHVFPDALTPTCSVELVTALEAGR